MPLFTQPLMLIGLAALPMLASIYLLRNRYRRQPVSSLLLWLDPREAHTGGPRIDRLQTPLLFFLELLLLLLLVAAAAAPFIPATEGGRPLVVVLDDSFSMLAGEPDSPRAAARKDLEEELRRKGHSSYRFILAGEKPSVLGEKADDSATAIRLLDGWHCRAPGAGLQEAIALAGELGGELAAILVITDRKPLGGIAAGKDEDGRQPGEVIGKGRLQWRAYGDRRDHLAIVTAARTHRDGADRLLLEVANLGDDPATAELTVESVDPPGILHRVKAELKKDELHRAVLQLGENVGQVRARLGNDLLPIDNEVSLLPAPARVVPVQLSLGDATLRRHTEKALRASRSARIVTGSPALLISDGAAPDLTGETWAFHLQGGKEALAFDGPFVIDRTHPLAEGLSLQGVIWAPGTKDELPGRGVVLAGNVGLLSDSEDGMGRHLVRLRLRHDLSTLLESPSWPVLLTNLLDWRGSTMPGLDRSNIRLGEETALTLTRLSEEVSLTAPGSVPRPLAVQDGRVVVRGDEIGVYEIRQGEDKTRFAVNALNREESDLRGCLSGRWGDWLDETALRLEYQEIGWLLLLLALGVATVHLLLTARLKGARS